MRRPGFTLLELMAVVALLGLTAAATAWSLADEARQSRWVKVVGDIAQVDRMARLSARRQGRPCIIRLDLDRQSLWRVSSNDYGQEASHTVALGQPVRMDRVRLPSPDGGGAWVDRQSGQVEIACSRAGQSVTYAVRLVAGEGSAPERGQAGWLVFAGLSGQVTQVENEDELDNLFASFTTRADAH